MCGAEGIDTCVLRDNFFPTERSDWQAVSDAVVHTHKLRGVLAELKKYTAHLRWNIDRKTPEQLTKEHIRCNEIEFTDRLYWHLIKN